MSGEIECWPGVKKGQKNMTHLLLPDIEGGKMSEIDEGWKIDKDGRAQKKLGIGGEYLADLDSP